MKVLKDWLKNYKMVWGLAKNDFATRYAGSYFGIFWAFVQPMVTVLLYVFVFQVAFKADPVGGDYPYVLWLIAGIIPWFFFSESVVNATNCFFEYSYLVKKVVFPISILPMVKIISSLFVHLFFIVFSWGIYIILGKMPGVKFIQVIYYLVCMLFLVTALAFFTSSTVPFFKDFSPIINIVMQIGMWMTPILWNIETIELGALNYLFKLNPMFYIVQGYRESFMNGYWFWQHPLQMLCFWTITGMLFVLGVASFKKMKPHFADVL